MTLKHLIGILNLIKEFNKNEYIIFYQMVDFVGWGFFSLCDFLAGDYGI